MSLITAFCRKSFQHSIGLFGGWKKVIYGSSFLLYSTLFSYHDSHIHWRHSSDFFPFLKQTSKQNHKNWFVGFFFLWFVSLCNDFSGACYVLVLLGHLFSIDSPHDFSTVLQSHGNCLCSSVLNEDLVPFVNEAYLLLWIQSCTVPDSCCQVTYTGKRLSQQLPSLTHLCPQVAL